MFVREKKNKSGKISIQIIDKSTGRYKVKKTTGSSDDKEEIKKLKQAAFNWLKDSNNQTEIDFLHERRLAESYLESIEQINIIGTDLLLGKIFNDIGFNSLNEPLFKELVFSRICYPVSKLKTADYLLKYHSLEVDVDKIYRYLDKLISKQKSRKAEYRKSVTIILFKSSTM